MPGGSAGCQHQRRLLAALPRCHGAEGGVRAVLYLVSDIRSGTPWCRSCRRARGRRGRRLRGRQNEGSQVKQVECMPTSLQACMGRLAGPAAALSQVRPAARQYTHNATQGAAGPTCWRNHHLNIRSSDGLDVGQNCGREGAAVGRRGFARVRSDEKASAERAAVRMRCRSSHPPRATAAARSSSTVGMEASLLAAPAAAAAGQQGQRQRSHLS